MDTDVETIPAVSYNGISSQNDLVDMPLGDSEPAHEDTFNNVKLSVDDNYKANDDMARAHGDLKTAGVAKVKTSQRNRVRVSDVASDLYFCKKGGGIEQSVEIIRNELLKSDLDGDIHTAWLLVELDHWDNEHEKVIIVTKNSLIDVRYDFITNKIKKSKRIPLHEIQEIIVGDIVYPKNSLMNVRDHGGIQIIYGNVQAVSFGQKWNPFSSDMPYLILCHHKLLYNETERDTKLFNVDDFVESLCKAVKQACSEKCPDKILKVTEGPINVETYLSLSSMVFNQSHLGFNRDRNGVSF